MSDIKAITLDRLASFNEWANLIDKMFLENEAIILEDQFVKEWIQKELALVCEMKAMTEYMKSNDFLDDESHWASGLNLLNRCTKHYKKLYQYLMGIKYKDYMNSGSTSEH